MAALATVSSAAMNDDPRESPDGPEAVRVYFTADQALARIFDHADAVEESDWIPTDRQRTEIQRRLGFLVSEAAFPVWRATRGDRDLGWAVILEEKGRFKPITCMIHVKPDRTVGQVLVMVYRESRGDGVKRQRFLKQFRSKDLDDSLRLNRDIIGLTGATLSSRAVTFAVRKALLIVDVREKGGQ
ncbi:hypothetical protein DRQ50_07175 [bacterium]|nr:MAG: hypothetical protein DRQ50_07175 [bacterium]